MKVLLDTHVLLWAIGDANKLSRRVRNILEDRTNEVFISSASFWEISTKYRIGRLPSADQIITNYETILNELDSLELSISIRHALTAGLFNTTHRDPFDRILAAQSLIENVALITQDKALSHFPINTIW